MGTLTDGRIDVRAAEPSDRPAVLGLLSARPSGEVPEDVHAEVTGGHVATREAGLVLDGPGPSRSSICSVWWPRNAPTSTMRRASAASITAATTSFQNWYMSVALERA
jgi:hypothetical protein